MKREFLTSLGIETEQVDKIMAEHGKTINSYKADVEGKTKEVDDLSKQLKDRDKQLEELGKKASGNEDLQKQITDLQEANKQAAKDYQDKLNKQAFEFALERSLADAQAKNPKAVKALLNTEAIKLDGDKLLGLEEQLKTLKESDSYLFAEAAPALSGRQPHIPNGSQQSTPRAQLQKDYETAVQSGDMPLAVALKNKLFTMTEEE